MPMSPVTRFSSEQGKDTAKPRIVSRIDPLGYSAPMRGGLVLGVGDHSCSQPVRAVAARNAYSMALCASRKARLSVDR